MCSRTGARLHFAFLPAVLACVSKPGWEAKGINCSVMESRQLCDGLYGMGVGWRFPADGELHSLKDSDGHDPSDACCACGGGERPLKPASELDAVGKCNTSAFVSFCHLRPEKCNGRLKTLHPCALPFTVRLWSTPQVVDWDSDGDLDLLVGGEVGSGVGEIKFFERVATESFVERFGESSPFQNVTTSGPGISVVDWDMDGDLDLLVGNYPGTIQYFERLSSGSLAERLGADNPFHNLQLGPGAFPCATDWDGDGDVDLLVGLESGHILYFERLSARDMVQRLGIDNPFGSIDSGSDVRLGVGDWDNDGDADLLVGSWRGTVRFFERNADATLKESADMIDVMSFIPWGFGPMAIPVDWDMDGDQDLLLGNHDGNLRLYRREDEKRVYVEQVGSHNPFNSIPADDWDVAPIAVDWDLDGDLDLLIGTTEEGVHYLERLGDGSLMLRNEDHNNPMQILQVSWSTDNGRRDELYGESHMPLPRVVDWDGDGDLDLAIGVFAGSLKYYERLANGSLARKRRGDEGYPFEVIDAGADGKKGIEPLFIDWDQDGDVDVLVKFGSNHTLRYFERVAKDSLVERMGSANPARNVQVSGALGFKFVDWDRDGDLDLIFGIDSGELVYYERTAHGELQQNLSVFASINSKLKAALDARPKPEIVDWNDEGVLDVLVGTGNGKVKCFKLAECRSKDACSGVGICRPILGTCSCPAGHGSFDCSMCEPNYFASRTLDSYALGLGKMQYCTPCPGVAHDSPCSARGRCMDDQRARRLNVSSTMAQLARGSGSCSCSDHFFGVDMHGRTDCSKGECPAGMQPVLGQTEGDYDAIISCQTCAPGTGKRDAGAGGCETCDISSYSPKGGAGICIACDTGWMNYKAKDSRTDCEIHFHASEFALALIFSILCVFSTASVLGTSCVKGLSFRGPPIYIQDVTLEKGHTIVYTMAPHRIHSWMAPCFRIEFHGTRNFKLNPQVTHSHFCAKVLSSDRLELLKPDGSSIEDHLCETSAGQAHMDAWDAFRSVGWPMPCATQMPFLLCGLLLAGLSGEVLSGLEWVIVCSMGLLLGTVAGSLRKRKWGHTRLERALKHYAILLRQQNPDAKACVRGAQRAVPVGALLDVLQRFAAFVRERNMYYMDPNVFMPLTAPYELSFAELIGSRRVDWFVSHYWGTSFRYTCNALKKHAMSVYPNAEKSWDQESYWICTLSNNQYMVGEELGDTWSESSFYKTLRSGFCKGTCMILDELALPLTRSWCLFELLQTLQLEEEDQGNVFAGLLFCTESGVLNYGAASIDVSKAIGNKLAGLHLAEAQASCQEDQAMIHSLVLESMGSFNLIDDKLKDHISKALQAAKSASDVEFNNLFHALALHGTSAGNHSKAVSV